LDLRLLSLALTLGGGLARTPGGTVKRADFPAERAGYMVETPWPEMPLAAQLPGPADKAIEIEGVASGREEPASGPADEASGPAAAKADGGQFTRAIPPRDFLEQAKLAAPALTWNPAAKRKPAWMKAAASRRAKLYARKIRQVNGNIDTDTAAKIAAAVLKKSRRHGVDPRLVFALLAQESGFDPRAVSPAGAQGLGQLMPGTARGLGVRDSFDIEQNVDGSVRYLAEQMRAFGGDFRQALAAYNAGPGNVQRYGGIPPFRETRNYVQRISTHYRQLKNLL